ncbi:MAG: hypothetical protein QOF76_1352 [Solirubrobacteraceae bacterium]|jgi:AcrR family transcriptional regulator|nr:hypothetical protein [Solirubrobacteraceae bacterium]
MTQQERSAATREALLDAAIECLIELGLERSSTGEISERAGLSRGAHLHHFQTRAILIAAAIERLADRGIADLAAAFEHLPEDDTRGEAALDTMWGLFNTPLFQCALALAVHAQTDPELHEALGPIEALSDRSLPWLRLAFAGSTDARSADEYIRIAAAMIRGVSVMALLERSDRATRHWAACRAHLVALLHAQDFAAA